MNPDFANRAATLRLLDPVLITGTCQRLSDRISERFPRSGLAMLARELVDLSATAGRMVTWLEKPIYWARIPVAIVLMATVGIVVVVARAVDWKKDTYATLSEFLQGADVVVNELILLGIALYFASSLETRIKRRAALGALHALRSMAHIVDMHQLTKLPPRLLAGVPPTPASPPREMSKVELGRYLGYCSELLALTSKIAALYIQKFNDDITLHSVGEVEKLCSSVSGKIWQKLWIVGGGELSVPGLDGAEREHALPIEDDSSARSLQAAPSLSSVGGEVTTPQGRAERVGDLGNPPARVTA